MDVLWRSLSSFYAGKSALTNWLTTLLLAVAVFLLFRRLLKGKSLLPPGPAFQWPLVGHIDCYRKPIHEYYDELAKRYGHIYGVRVGVRYVVVVSDYEMIKEMCNSDDFTPRPKGVFSMSKEYENFGEMSGQAWKDHRRLIIKSMRSVGMGTSKGEIDVQNQIDVFSAKLKRRVKEESRVRIRPVIVPAVKNIIFGMICGETFENDPEAIEIIDGFTSAIMDYMFEIIQAFYFPWKLIKLFLSGSSRKHDQLQRKFDTLLKNEIAKHKKNRIEDPSDYMDFYLQEMVGKPEESKFTEPTLVGNSLIMLLAGSDSIRISLEWCLEILAENPSVQQRVYQEIADVSGKERRPSWDDRSRLPFTQAFILEVFRWKEILPVNDPRAVEEDVVFRDYLIPNGTVVLFNFQAVHQDREFWGDPEKFRPERFLTSDRKSIDTKYSERVLSFSLGKRSCPGERLAVVQMFLYFSAIVQQFKLAVPPNVRNEEKRHFAPELVDPEICFEVRD